MRIDSHQHFWTYDPEQYGWMTDEMGALRRDYGPSDLAPLLDAAGLDGSVAVQARQSLEETRYLLELARGSQRVVGVVGWVDLCSGEVEAQLDELSGEAALVGVRHIVQDEPDDGFMDREDFRRGIAALAARDLVYDVLTYPRQLGAAIRLVQEFPDQPFVLDHISKPFVKKGAVEPWASEIRGLAALPNVSCKVSGMITEADWKGWRPEHFDPYLDVVLEAFGEERLMYGSDWPVCRLAGEYAEVASLAERFAERLSESGRAAFYGGTAARVYGIAANRGDL